jgi:drug/metabolite transporter (DMT)-like permease
MATSAIFVALFDPILNKRKILGYEVILATIAMIGFVIIFQINDEYREGVFYALISAILLAFFSILNGKNIKKYRAIHIAFYELLFASVFLLIVLVFQGELINSIRQISLNDIFYLMVLATICTAYPFVVVTNLLHKMSPFTIILTNNLEPVYGIILAILIFGSKEKMDLSFYLGAIFIFSSVILNGLMKFKAKYKS